MGLDPFYFKMLGSPPLLRFYTQKNLNSINSFANWLAGNLQRWKDVTFFCKDWSVVFLWFSIDYNTNYHTKDSPNMEVPSLG